MSDTIYRDYCRILDYKHVYICIHVYMYVHVRPLQNHNCINYILYTPTLNYLGLMKNCLDHVLKSQNLYMDWIFYIKRKKKCFGSLKYHSLLSLTGDCLTHPTIYQTVNIDNQPKWAFLILSQGQKHFYILNVLY